MLLLLLLLNIYQLYASENEYGAVIDAGSTGSRIYTFKWPERTSPSSLSPQTVPIEIGDMEGESPTTAISNIYTVEDVHRILGPLIVNATNTINDPVAVSQSPIFLKATAGLRILNETRRETIMKLIRNEFLNNKTFCPFDFSNEQAVIASGEEEATFDWVAVNYAGNKLFQKQSDITYGALDLGGMSTQIAFAAQPSSDILSGFTGLRLWGYTYRLYTYSFLRYGTNGLEQQLAQLIYDNTQYQTSPCLNNGYSKNYTLNVNGVPTLMTINGSSVDNPGVCHSYLKQLLYNSTICFTGNCALNGVYMPDIPKNMRFYAFSAFAYQIGNSQLPNNVTLTELLDTANDICNMTYQQAIDVYNKTYNVSVSYVYNLCFLDTYIYTLLVDGYGFDPDNSDIIFGTKLNGTSLNWASGSIIRDANWLSWDISQNSENNNDDSLTSEGKVYRSLMIVFAALFVIAMGIVVYCHISKKKNSSNNYSSM